MESSVQGVDHVIWTGLNVVEIGVEYRKIFVAVFFDDFIAEQSVLFLDPSENKKIV